MRNGGCGRDEAGAASVYVGSLISPRTLLHTEHISVSLSFRVSQCGHLHMAYLRYNSPPLCRSGFLLGGSDTSLVGRRAAVRFTNALPYASVLSAAAGE